MKCINIWELYLLKIYLELPILNVYLDERVPSKGIEGVLFYIFFGGAIVHTNILRSLFILNYVI